MIVIGLSGALKHGKSTVAKMLAEIAPKPILALEFHYPIMQVCNAWLPTLPEYKGEDVIEYANSATPTLASAFRRFVNRDIEPEAFRIELDNPASMEINVRLIEYLGELIKTGAIKEIQKIEITEDNRVGHRALLQWMGAMGATKILPNVWCEMLSNQIKEAKTQGYSLVTVGGVRFADDAEMVRQNGGLIVKIIRPGEGFSDDITEKVIAGIRADAEVINNGNLEELQNAVGELWHDLSAASLLANPQQPKRYFAKQDGNTSN